MMSMAGMSILLFALPALLLPFLYIYLLHDYSGRREGKRDPMLGAKVFTTLLMKTPLPAARVRSDGDR